MKSASRRRRGVSGRHRSARTGQELAVDGADGGTINEIQDWQGLSLGMPVEVRLPGGFVFHGRVDAKTGDSSVVWVISSAGLRQMFGHREGVRVEPLGNNL